MKKLILLLSLFFSLKAIGQTLEIKRYDTLKVEMLVTDTMGYEITTYYRMSHKEAGCLDSTDNKAHGLFAHQILIGTGHKTYNNSVYSKRGYKIIGYSGCYTGPCDIVLSEKYVDQYYRPLKEGLLVFTSIVIK